MGLNGSKHEFSELPASLLPGGDLELEVEQAWDCTSGYILSYLGKRANNAAGLNSRRSALMATGRFEWLLREARPRLSGLFNASDVLLMINCYNGNMFSPDQLDSIPFDLCVSVGINLKNYESSDIASLIAKIRTLDRLQLMTLVDALENIWFQPPDIRMKTPQAVLESLGIYLK